MRPIKPEVLEKLAAAATLISEANNAICEEWGMLNEEEHKVNRAMYHMVVDLSTIQDMAKEGSQQNSENIG